jgi:hypothetical protein
MVHPLSATEAEDLYIMRMYLEPLIYPSPLKLQRRWLLSLTPII